MLGIYGIAHAGQTGFSLGLLFLSLVGAIVVTSFVVMTSQIWDGYSGFTGNLFKAMWVVAFLFDCLTSWAANWGLMGAKPENQIFAAILTFIICAAPITLGATLKRQGTLDIR